MRYLLSTFFPLLLLLSAFQSPQDSLRQHSEAADAYRRAGNLAAAEREYTAVLAEGYAKLGKVYSAEENYQQAISALESAISYQPDSQEALIDLAIAYFDAEQYEKALKPLGTAIGNNPRSAGAHHMLGKSYFMLGDFGKSTAELKTALELTPKDYDVAYTSGLGLSEATSVRFSAADLLSAWSNSLATERSSASSLGTDIAKQVFGGGY